MVTSFVPNHDNEDDTSSPSRVRHGAARERKFYPQMLDKGRIDG